MVSTRLPVVSMKTFVVLAGDQFHQSDAPAEASPACWGSPGSIVANLLFDRYNAPPGGTLVALAKSSFGGIGTTLYATTLVLLVLAGAVMRKLKVRSLVEFGTCR